MELLNDILSTVNSYRAEHPQDIADSETSLDDHGENISGKSTGSIAVESKKMVACEFTLSREVTPENITSILDSTKTIVGSHWSDFECDILEKDLLSSSWTGVSIRPFLWLVGWCNATDLDYRRRNFRPNVQELAQVMFGYIPTNPIEYNGSEIDLKPHRFRDRVDEAVRQAALTYHRGNVVRGYE